MMEEKVEGVGIILQFSCCSTKKLLQRPMLRDTLQTPRRQPSETLEHFCPDNAMSSVFQHKTRPKQRSVTTAMPLISGWWSHLSWTHSTPLPSPMPSWPSTSSQWSGWLQPSFSSKVSDIVIRIERLNWFRPHFSQLVVQRAEIKKTTWKRQ